MYLSIVTWLLFLLHVNLRVLGVEGLQEDRPPTAPASSTARMRAAAEVEASSDSHTHHGMSYIGSRAAKSFIKGLGKTTMVFDKLGSFLK